MAKIQKFEDAKIWQSSREIVRQVYLISQKNYFSKDYSLKDQIRRAAVSVMSNIAEGFERTSDKEFLQYLNVSKGSVGEVRSQLYIALDMGYITEEEFISLKNQCESVSRHIWSFMNYLKQGFKPVH